MTEQLQCRHDVDISRPPVRQGRGVVRCRHCDGDGAAAPARRGSAAVRARVQGSATPDRDAAAPDQGAAQPDTSAPISAALGARSAAYGDVFSAASEARVCELVLGDRRHGLHVTGGQP